MEQLITAETDAEYSIDNLRSQTEPAPLTFSWTETVQSKDCLFMTDIPYSKYILLYVEVFPHGFVL